MRVFHFVNDKYGIENIRYRRLKIATIHDLNDPFEFLGMSLREKRLRRFFALARDEFARRVGLLCFSKGWHNPVLWSHYAAGHSGLCLGFEVPSDHLTEVRYSDARIAVRSRELAEVDEIDARTIQEFMHTKYEHWRYEDEVRAFRSLPANPAINLHFASFSDDLRLVTVIVGARSKVTRDELTSALGDLRQTVKVIQARLAFRSFRVVQQLNRKLWFAFRPNRRRLSSS